jgi:hypothetical protein
MTFSISLWRRTAKVAREYAAACVAARSQGVEHHPLCDSIESPSDMVEGIVKPCNCAASQGVGAPVASRNAFAVATLRSALRQARNVGGQNATMHVGDVLELLDQVTAGKMDDALGDPDGAVSGPTFLSSTRGASKS